jgi:hypothetical protein
MSDEKMTHILFIDADIIWNPYDIIKLLMNDKHVVGGAYPLKDYKWEKISNTENIKKWIDTKNKSILKQHKIKLLSNIESNLLNDEVIDLKTFHVLCILENINYLFIDKNFYYEKIIDEENKLFVLHKFNNIYSYEINNKNNYKENKLQKIEIDKNFHSISYYTLKNLKEICEKLHIVIQPTWKKKDIYEFLIK